METREEKLAKWADPAIDELPSLRALKGSLPLNHNDSEERIRISDTKVQFDQVEEYIRSTNGANTNSDDDNPNVWHFEAFSFPRLRPGRLVLSMTKRVFKQIEASWNLHPRTIEVFLSNNGVFTTFHCPSSKRTSLLLKVANSRSTGYDCVSVTCDPTCRTIYALYHHLEDEASVFTTLLATPERCLDPHFFVATLYRSHHQHIEAYRNTIDDAILGMERQTGFGAAGSLVFERRPRLDGYPALANPKSVIQRLSYCQTDLAIIGHAARCCLDCGEWLLRCIDEGLLSEQLPHNRQGGCSSSRHHQLDQQSSETLGAVRLTVRQDVEYVRKRTVMLLSQVQQMRDRAQSQTNFVSITCRELHHATADNLSKMLNTITQSDAEYTAAIAVDGKRDSIAMKTIATLGIVFLPGTFVATLFSINMFDWGVPDGGETSSLTASPSMWIYWAITVPLTLMTLIVWMLWSRRENHKSNERLMIYRTKAPVESSSSAATKVSSLLSSAKMV